MITVFMPWLLSVLARLVFKNLSGPMSFVIVVSPGWFAIADGIGIWV
jgi:hypothetical protein